MEDDYEEGWIYLRHAERQNLQRQRNASAFSFAMNMDAAIKRAEQLTAEHAERIGWAEGCEPKLIRIVDDA